MKIKVMLKNGYKFSGTLIEETETHYVIDDIKLGKTELLKSEVIIKTEVSQ